MKLITSRHNPRVKQAAALRSRKAREASQRTLVYGPRETLRAIEAGARLVEAFVCPPLLRGADSAAAATALRDSGVEVLETSVEVFEKLAYGDRLDGVVSIATTPRRPLEHLLDSHAVGQRPLVAVIEGVEKPGNLGAVLRSADGAGFDAVVVADPVIDLFGPNVIRASTGTVFKPNIAVASSEAAVAWLATLRVPLYATRPDADEEYTAADFSAGCAVILGAESTGLTDVWRREAVRAIGLPMRGVADSLNLSATAAVLFYEAQRQRNEAQR